MRAGPLLFRITGIVVFIQLAVGGLLTFDFISAAPHIIVGFIVLALAVATMVVVWVSKPAFRPMRMTAAGLVAMILVQIVLGFATLGTGSSLLAWIHLIVALGIYGMAVAGTFMAMRWDQMAKQGMQQGS
jgi:heme A synthase